MRSRCAPMAPMPWEACSPANCSRSRVFSIFPVAPSGIASTKATSSGTCHLATRPFVVREQFLARDFGVRLPHDDEQRALVPLRMRDRDAGRHGHGRMGHRDVLDFDRADPLASRLDDVLAAVGDVHVAIGIDRRDVAGREPRHARLVGLQRIAAVGLVVLAHDPRSAHQQVAKGRAVPWQVAAVVADDLHVDAVEHAALLVLHLDALVGRHARGASA